MEECRRCSAECERARLALERMESREGPRAQGYQPRVTGAASSGMGATDARIDYEERMRARLRRDYHVVDLACSVIYGDEDSGGVGALLGDRYADCLWWRFCACETWHVVAERCGMSESWCRAAVPVALETVDSYGLVRVAAGVGIAEG